MSNSMWKVLSGKVVNKQYMLKSLLGIGGFGAVFLADEMVGDRLIREVAIKMVVSDESHAQLDELVTATKVQHPNLLRYITGGECHLMDIDFRYLVMELAHTSLETEFKARKLSDSEVRDLVRDIAAGLAYLHKHSIVHRDLKPGNILRVGTTWKIADFGLVKEIKQQTHITNNLMGTPIYMSPDALRGKVNSAWDMWSLGVLILEVLTGKFPYQTEKRNPEEVIQDILYREPNIPYLQAPWKKIVEGCLTKDYKTRIRATEVLEILTPFSPSSSPSKSIKSVLVCGGVIISAIFGINLVFQPAPPMGKTPITTVTTSTPSTPDSPPQNRPNPSESSPLTYIVSNSWLTRRCNQQADAIFYRRHPELVNRAIAFHDLDSANEWNDVRNSLPDCWQVPIVLSLRTCNKKTNKIFYYRHPELEGELLDENNASLAQEWKQIRRRIPGCSQHGR